jgi:hypothetical protein
MSAKKCRKMRRGRTERCNPLWFPLRRTFPLLRKRSVVVMRRLLDYWLFPVVLAATLGAGFETARLLNRHGWDGKDWKSWIAGWVAFWGFVVAIRFIEKVRPFEPAWNCRDDQLANDIVLPLVSSLVFLAVPFATWYANTLTWAVSWAAGRVPLLHVLHIWPAHWPAIIGIPIGIIVLDLGPHLAHRWSHTTKLLWRFHSVHHSAPRLCVINTHPSYTAGITAEIRRKQTPISGKLPYCGTMYLGAIFIPSGAHPGMWAWTSPYRRK